MKDKTLQVFLLLYIIFFAILAGTFFTGHKLIRQKEIIYKNNKKIEELNRDKISKKYYVNNTVIYVFDNIIETMPDIIMDDLSILYTAVEQDLIEGENKFKNILDK